MTGKGIDPGERRQLVLEQVDRTRPRVREELITMAHGDGSQATRTLVESAFPDSFRSPLVEPPDDADGSGIVLTTDSYVVSPLFFPGGSIADLAINGTVNDLAVSGATPLYLTAGLIVEEGFPVADLTRVVSAMRDAAAAAGVTVVIGDTKVVARGKADGCYVSMAGVGAPRPGVALGVARARPGDAIIVSGPVGDHGITVMLARDDLDVEADIKSDTAALNGLAAALLDSVPDTRAMRDAKRGGVATILSEIATGANVGVLAREDAVPVGDVVRGACEMLGIDPLHVACEGRMVAVVPGPATDRAVAALRSHPLGADAAVIGHVTDSDPGLVHLQTTTGGTRVVDLPDGDLLPRIS